MFITHRFMHLMSGHEVQEHSPNHKKLKRINFCSQVSYLHHDRLYFDEMMMTKIIRVRLFFLLAPLNSPRHFHSQIRKLGLETVQEL